MFIRYLCQNFSLRQICTTPEYDQSGTNQRSANVSRLPDLRWNQCSRCKSCQWRRDWNPLRKQRKLYSAKRQDQRGHRSLYYCICTTQALRRVGRFARKSFVLRDRHCDICQQTWWSRAATRTVSWWTNKRVERRTHYDFHLRRTKKLLLQKKFNKIEPKYVVSP